MYECTAVIPTVLRPSVRAAIDSVKSQSECDTEAVVVVDRARERCTAEELTYVSRADKLIFTGGGLGAAAARNLGLDEATARYSGFLDDDDVWHKTKAKIQIDEARAGTRKVLVSCRFQMEQSGSPGVPIPKGLYSADQLVQDYLFRKRAVAVSRNSLHTSTLLAETDALRDLRWDARLPRHQDWDLLLRSQGRMSIVQLPQVLVSVAVGTGGSISAKADWQSSQLWAESHGDDWSPATMADFLWAQPMRYALQARSLAGMRSVLRSWIGTRRAPSLSCLAIGIAGAFGRPAFERSMAVSAKVHRQRTRLEGGSHE